MLLSKLDQMVMIEASEASLLSPYEVLNPHEP
jgi:hypothetical protein